MDFKTSSATNDSNTKILILLNNENQEGSNQITEKLTNDNLINTQIEENISNSKLFMLIANLLFVVSGILQKYFFIYNSKNGLLVYSFYRYFGVILFFYLQSYKDSSIEKKSILSVFSYPKHTFNWLVCRIISLILNTLCSLLSIMHLKVAVSICLFMFQPIFTNILAVLLAGENFQLKFMIGCLISLFGAFVITIGKDQVDNYLYERNFYLGVIATLLNAFFASLNTISLKVLSKSIDQYNLNYLSSSYCSFLSIIIIVVYSTFFDSTEIYCLIDFIGFSIAFVNGFVLGFSYYFMFLSFKLADASKTSYLTYIQLPVVTLIGYLMFSEILNIIEFIGCLIIVVNVVIVTLYLK